MPARRPDAAGRIATSVGVAAALLAVGTASADRVFAKKGPPVRGVVTRTDTEVVVNKYRATSALMTYGVVRIPVGDVKKVDEEENVLETVRRKHEDLAPTDVAGRVGLAKYAQSQHLVREADRLLEEALYFDPTHAEALALYGGVKRFDAARRGNPASDPLLRKAVQPLLAEPDDRKAERDFLASAKAGAPTSLRPEAFARVRRSAREPKGERDFVALRSGGERFPGATYAIYVPETYDAWTPLPLLVALHDGGKGGKDGTSVVGSGKDAVTLYGDGAKERGWILVAPTALAAPWTAKDDEPFVFAVLDEVLATWNVDLDRVFLVGHGMGGDGAAAIGARHLDRFAGIACSSSTGGGAALKAAKSAGAAVFLYHADDDPSAPVEGTRAAADSLLAMDADLVYLELPGQGHAFPSEASREMFAFFRVKRLADSRRSSDWPRSSLIR